ncbi:MAG: phosphoheptose isomerase [Bdellovibrionales bacterium RIFOXYB1_FULL_37_110]|nr:MAG: phosphoheptose isomerase [Bdellovibrionales bacterium RIFOXYC1_FULL_37_79]OFZ60828.1 MAG: phosphoheptose isomerase [Bdellovibrionales bacterium RIFOXYB1_FULL_37_110]OFZ62358.1 MAG: phosphoheptose isomerase [Bdellovibrionales bacterium RIFOXYD1_FULL_36_51]OFZ66769.1 MAG: phosphoheptose isomerase [Bdellovibrionales bacterium RIFOXYB2_FULL_36_6]
MGSFVQTAFLQAQKTLEDFVGVPDNIDLISRSVNILVETLKRNGTIYSCGNGGSMCDAAHFAEELTGYFRKKRPPLRALAINDPSYISCVSNDLGYEFIFSRFLESFGKSGDTLIALSTSGNSLNVINATETAKKNGIKVIGLLGKDGGKLKKLVDIPIIVPAHSSDRIQEVHIKIIHILVEGIERSLYPENYT